MNLTYTRPGELRKPDVEVLPDGRIRITRFIAAGHGDRDQGEVTQSFGATDSGLTTALLVKKGMTRIEGKDAIVKTWEVRNPTGETPVGNEDVQWGENGLKTVIADFVQMSTQPYTPQTVGTTTSTYDPTCVLRNEVMEDDGSTRQIRRFYINKGLINQVDEVRNNGALLIKTLVYLNDAPSPNPPSGYTLIATKVDNPGGLETTTYTFAKGDGKISEENETRNYGALFIRTIRWMTAPGASNPIPAQAGYTSFSSGYVEQDGYRIWTSQFAQGSGQLSDQTETKYNGALYLRTIRYASDPTVTVNPITTPTGYTLVSVSESLEGGVKIWTVQYAKGSGQISQDDETRNNGALLIRTIRYLTDASITSNPITTPTGYVNVSVSYAEQDGYKLWTASYAKGNGQAGQEDEQRNNGRLAIRTIRYLSAPSVTSNPITTPGGYVLVSSGYADQEGHRVWTASYASGSGQISQQDDTRNNGNLLLRTIRHLTDPSTSVSPISTPTGYSLISSSYEDASGYRVWTGSFAKGDGVINSGTELRNKGKLAIYKTTKLGSVPTTPSATIGGTVVLIDSNTRQQDGYTLYDYTWAEGYGTITSETDSRNQGKLKVYHIVSLGVDPSTPSATIGGTVVLIENATREESGVTIYDKRWAEGYGVIEKHLQMRDAGLRLETWVSIGGAYDSGFMQPAGVVMMKDNQDNDGVTRWTVTCMQGSDGGAPTAYTYSTQAYNRFTYPGRAKLFQTSTTVGSTTYLATDMFMSPPVSALVLETTTISYQTSNAVGALTYSLWNPVEWASLRASLVLTTGYPKQVVQALEGYTSDGGSTASVTAAGTSTSSMMGYWIAPSSTATAYISGGPTMPNGTTTYSLSAMVEKEPAFTAYDGTQYYRKIVITATPPAAPAMPV